MALYSMGGNISASVDTNTKKIKFDATFVYNTQSAPIVAGGTAWSIDSVKEGETPYTPSSVGLSITSDGILSYSDNTPANAIISVGVKPYRYGLNIERYNMYFTFRLYDFGVRDPS